MSVSRARVWALRLADVRRRIHERRDHIMRKWEHAAGPLGWLTTMMPYEKWQAWRDAAGPFMRAFVASSDARLARVDRIAEKAQGKS